LKLELDLEPVLQAEHTRLLLRWLLKQLLLMVLTSFLSFYIFLY